MTPAMTHAEREESSAFGHPEVTPDATLGYGPHPDQVVDFFLPRAAPAAPGVEEAVSDAEATASGAAPVAPDAGPAVLPAGPAVLGAELAAAGGRLAVGRRVPLVVLLHGGAWRAPYDRRHLSPLAGYLAEHGFAVASVEYRRGSPAGASSEPSAEPSIEPPAEPARPRAGRWPETFDDVAAALDALPGLVRRLACAPASPPPTTDGGTAGATVAGAAPTPTAAGLAPAPLATGAGPTPVASGSPVAAWSALDAERPVLVGHSAGGHAVLWAAARHRLPVGSRWRLPGPPALRGVVALAPIADFTTARALGVCSHAVDELLTPPASAPPAPPAPVAPHAAPSRTAVTSPPPTAVAGSPPPAAVALLTHRLACTDPAALVPTGIPTTVVQGALDEDVPPAVAEAFVAAAGAAGQRVRLVRLAGVGHFPPIDPAAPAARTVLAEIARLV